MAKLAGKIEFRVRDKDGNLILKREQPSRSFLFHFIELVYVYHGQIDRDMDDVGGILRTVKYKSEAYPPNIAFRKANLAICAGPGVTPFYPCVGRTRDDYGANISADLRGKDFGIVVGMGAGAPTPQDNALAQKILHGRGTNQLEHGGSEVLEPAFSDPNGEMVLRRYFTNRSGATITLTECGIYAVGTDFYDTLVSEAYVTNRSWAFDIVRDLVTPNIDVLNNQILEVKYLIQTTV